MGQAATVLLAEADRISTQLLSFILERAGFQVIAAQGGADALRLARQHKVDLILSEVLLPDADGMEVCRQLRADWNTRYIPFVLLTSLGDPEYRVRGLLAGADDYVAKPFDLNELMVRLRRLIETFAACGQVHPLTRLPSSMQIQLYVSQVCLQPDSGPWAYLQIDLNHFRAYNHMYGYEAGNEVLRMTGALLRDIVYQMYGAGAFVGHDGRDDFVVVLPTNEAALLCEDLISRFDERILAFYPPEHRERLYQMWIDRRGDVQQVPRVALSIGVVTSELCDALNYLELAEVGTAVLNRARAEAVSFYYVNRRRSVGRSQPVPAGSS
jgi:DNA-binding response OmpR family regulator